MFSSNHPIIFVTSNPDKLRDARKILGSDRLLETRNADLVEIQGEPVEIARHKCIEALRLHRDTEPTNQAAAIVIEDTALCMNALGGLPGPFIKWFQRRLTPADLHRMLSGFSDYRAQFVSTVAVGSWTSDGSAQIRIFQSVINGEIVPPRGLMGDRGGWDPCFRPLGSPKTFGEMEEGERATYCARLAALTMLRTALYN
ncbi:Inosine triphosphate pyrophosphatase-like protein [Aphelenchoides besseyi]|nr:Inosine triphosphate pyrophosphatase-like protein [Aphelenchoides besseyi]KAI6193591.1 Inosine triphosphate pyrophosphatase-like protein [Aphelenchoides besseyi]